MFGDTVSHMSETASVHYESSYSSPATWNSIPTSIKNCSSLYSLQCHLKSHLIAQLLQLTCSVWPPGDCLRLRFMIHDYVHVINLLLLLCIIIMMTAHRVMHTVLAGRTAQVDSKCQKATKYQAKDLYTTCYLSSDSELSASNRNTYVPNSAGSGDSQSTENEKLV